MSAADRARLVAEARDALDGIDRNAHGELEGVGRMERAIDALATALEAADADAKRWQRLPWRIRRDVKIIEAHEGGESFKEIGARLGLNAERIRQIVRGSRLAARAAEEPTR